MRKQRHKPEGGGALAARMSIPLSKPSVPQIEIDASRTGSPRQVTSWFMSEKETEKHYKVGLSYIGMLKMKKHTREDVLQEPIPWIKLGKVIFCSVSAVNW